MLYSTVRIQRIWHVSLMLTFAAFISMWFKWPYGFWVPITVAAIVLPLDSGLVVRRAWERYLGTLLGLILFIPIWMLLQADYRLIFLFTPVFLALSNFYLHHNYTQNVAFLTLSVGVMLGYTSSTDSNFYQFLGDRFIATLIGVGICISFEALTPYRYKYSYYELQYVTSDLLALLDKSLLILRQEIQANTVKPELVNQLTVFNQELLRLRDRKNSVLAEYNTSAEVTGYLDKFVRQVEEFRLILISAYYICYSFDEHKVEMVNPYLVKLQQIIAELKVAISTMALNP
ncbi:MAG: FUSC family protein [Burkholderiales bacterium]